MQVCLFNSTNVPIFVKEIGMKVGAKAKSRVLTETERLAIINEYPGLRFVNVLLETETKAKKVEPGPEVLELMPEEESFKPKRKHRGE